MAETLPIDIIDIIKTIGTAVIAGLILYCFQGFWNNKQIESLADDLQYEMTKSTIKLTNIKDILDKRFVLIDEHRQKDIRPIEPELFLNIDFEHLPEEIKKDPSKYIDVLQALAKYEEFKKEKSKDVMFG